MNSYLNELETLKIAENIETEGLRFYTEAMNKAENDEIKNTFKMLADEEKGHATLFAKIYNEAKKESQSNDDYIYDETTSAYLKALADSALFNTKGITNEKLKDVKDSKEALLMGIQAEKDAILLYTKMYQVSKFENTKKYLGELIKEENDHLEKLMKIYKNM
jgi:rubrerythrin